MRPMRYLRVTKTQPFCNCIRKVTKGLSDRGVFRGYAHGQNDSRWRNACILPVLVSYKWSGGPANFGVSI